MSNTLFVTVTGFTKGSDGRVYPVGSYALVDEANNWVASNSITGSVPLLAVDYGSDLTVKFVTACRDDCGDQSSNAVSVAGNI